MPAPLPPVTEIAVLGSADRPGLADQVVPRVVEQQLTRRLPGWRVTHWAPEPAPFVADGGLGALPLPASTPPALLQVACPLGPPADRLADACWLGVRLTEPVRPRGALVAVRDRRSRDLVHEAGGEAVVVGHPALLAGELFDADHLADRRTTLRLLGVLPATGSYLVTQSADLPATALDTLRSDTGAEHVVTLPGDLVPHDRLAIVSGAEAVVATDEHVAAVAAGLAVRWVLLDEHGRDRPAALEFGWAHQIVERPGQLPAALRSVPEAQHKEHATTSLAQFLDRLAEHAGRRLAAAPAAERTFTELAAENAALRVANDRLRERLVVERRRLAEPLVTTLSERDAALSERDAARAEAAEATRREHAALSRLATAERELAAWRNTKLVRWSSPLRDVYGKLRHR